MNFDYYYGDESNQFAFYRIPRQLITGEAFKSCPQTQNSCTASCWTAWACPPKRLV